MDPSAQANFACSSLKPKTFCSMTTLSVWPNSMAKQHMKNIWDQPMSRPLLT
ncbi:hypothetical protein MC885_006602 [Smutsia gigantea]|nr:hypothetical protein MC885_006602 [Smutsia gigantea]